MCIRSQNTRNIIANLDHHGIHISVIKIKDKAYEYRENFEIIKTYRQLRSIHKRIKRKHNQVTNSIINNGNHSQN